MLFVDGPRAAAVAGIDRAQTVVLSIEEDLPRLIAEFDGAQPPPPRVAEDDPAVLLYTSGTSGDPKGALHSQRNLLAVVDYHRYLDAIATIWTGGTYDRSAPSDSRYLLTSSLFHITSLHNTIVPRLATGSTVVMNQAGTACVPCSNSSRRNRSPTGWPCRRWRRGCSRTKISTDTTSPR